MYREKVYLHGFNTKRARERKIIEKNKIKMESLVTCKFFPVVECIAQQVRVTMAKFQYNIITLYTCNLHKRTWKPVSGDVCVRFARYNIVYTLQCESVIIIIITDLCKFPS